MKAARQPCRDHGSGEGDRPAAAALRGRHHPRHQLRPRFERKAAGCLGELARQLRQIDRTKLHFPPLNLNRSQTTTRSTTIVVPVIDRSDGPSRWNAASTSRRAACWRSRCARIRSPTISRTPPRPATSPTAAQGRLTTVTGFTVLGTNGKPISIGDPSTVTVAPDGTVTSNGKTAGRIAVVSLANAVKQGDTLFSGTPGARPKGTQVEQGF